VIVKQIGRTIAQLKERGFTIVLVEQNVRFASRIADRHVVIDQGRTVDLLTHSEAIADPGRLQRHLTV